MARARDDKGRLGFETHYADLYKERWPGLKASLSNEAKRERQKNGYVMDPASVLAAQALGVQPGEKVLDLCAAPGGKALVLLQALGAAGTLTANDRSQARFRRLSSVIREHVSSDLRGRVRLTRCDGRRFGRVEPRAYDAVLADVPCSSERHVLSAPSELDKWSRSRSRRLAKEQLGLLLAATRACREGGRIVYATCAIEPIENDGVIGRLLEKFDVMVVAPPIPLEGAEPTKHGWQFLPDRSGLGPIYLSCLKRT